MKTSGCVSWFRSICLGEGAQGVVYLASRTDHVDGDTLPVQFAIKSALILSSYSLCNEEQILKSFSSQYVIACYGSKITPAEPRPLCSDYNLILEYCLGGSIADFVKYRGKRMVDSDVQLFALHILKGINYIHSKKIIHCDIKPANILLKPVDVGALFVVPLMPIGFEANLADFGLALRKDSNEYGDGCGFTRGTLLYMSPELLYYGSLDYCADIWSYGCTVLEMFTGKRLWSELGLTDRKKLKDIIGNSNVKPEIPTWLSDDARDFLQKCLEKDPQQRYDSTDLLKHKFLMSVYDHCNIGDEAKEGGRNENNNLEQDFQKNQCNVG